MNRHFCVVVNPTAASGRALAAQAQMQGEFDRLGASYRVIQSDSLAHAANEAGFAVQRGEEVVAVGGDGLLGAIAGAMRSTDGVLALIPAGRGNDLARVLGIPTDARAAARLAVGGEPRRVDVGEVDGRSFLGIASVGFDSVANQIANRTRLIKGRAVYLTAALRALARWHSAAFEVTADGEVRKLTGYSVAVANSRCYGGGMLIAPHARLDDGRLEVVMVAAKSKLGILACFPRVFRGTHLSDPDVHLLSAGEVTIAADRPFTMYADGEPLADLPATVRVHPRALSVIASEPTSG